MKNIILRRMFALALVLTSSVAFTAFEVQVKPEKSLADNIDNSYYCANCGKDVLIPHICPR